MRPGRRRRVAEREEDFFVVYFLGVGDARGIGRVGIGDHSLTDRMVFDLSPLRAALPRKTSASLNLLLAVTDMREGNAERFRKNLRSAIEAFGDGSIVSKKFNTLTKRPLSLLTEALGTGRTAFVKVLLLEFGADPNVVVDGRSALKRALVEDEAQFRTLMEAGFERYVAPRTLEDYVGEKCPEGLSRVKAWLEARRSREKVVTTKKEVRVGRSLSETTLSYGHVTESVEVATVGSGEVSSVRAAESTVTQEPSTTTTEAEGTAESNNRFEDYALGIIREDLIRLTDLELEITRYEIEGNSPDDINRLLSAENSLEEILARLDSLFEGENEETVTRLLRRHRQHATNRVLTACGRIDRLLEPIVYEE